MLHAGPVPGRWEVLRLVHIFVDADACPVKPEVFRVASRCLNQGARVIGPNGKSFTENNIGQTVASRDLLSELRGAEVMTDGPPPLKKRDRSRFLQQLDEVIQSIRRNQSS